MDKEYLRARACDLEFFIETAWAPMVIPTGG
jgi:hypothetical protein